MNSTYTSRNICRIGSYDNSLWLKAHCTCMDNDHVHTLNLDFDEELDILDLVIYHKSFTAYKDNFHCKGFWQHLEYWYKDKVQRFKWIMSIIFRGYIETEASFEFHGIEQINDYLSALANGRDKILYNQKMRTTSHSDHLQVDESGIE